jgi:hypothetical protein
VSTFQSIGTRGSLRDAARYDMPMCIRRAQILRKLLKLKEWLTVPDAARHLAILLQEDVSEADVLRLALDGHLTLSVRFVNKAKAHVGRIVPLKEAKLVTLDMLGKKVQTIEGLHIRDRGVLELGEAVETIEGVWDLAMVGAEASDVEHRYQGLTGGPGVTLIVVDGTIVCREDGIVCQLLDFFETEEPIDKEDTEKRPKSRISFYPAGGLQSDSVLVVRTSALRQLEAQLLASDQPSENPIGLRERTTLLVIIAALAKMAKLDVNRPSKAAAAIESQTILDGVRVAARTIEGHLNCIPDALESRQQA